MQKGQYFLFSKTNDLLKYQAMLILQGQSKCSKILITPTETLVQCIYCLRVT